MKKKNKFLVAILAVLLAGIIAVAAVVGLSLKKSGGDYLSQISTAQAYMDKGNYDQAIVSFQKAIKKDSSRTEGYSGLAQAYIKKGYTTLAQEILQEGIGNTKSTSLQLAYANYFGEFVDPEGTPTLDKDEIEQDVTTKKDTQAGGSENSINNALLQYVGAANFGNYRSKYGIADVSHNGNIYSYTVKSINAVLNFDNSSGNVIDPASGYPYEQSYPASVIFNDLSVVFTTVVNKGITVAEVKKMNSVHLVKESSSELVIEVSGCKMTIQLEADGTIAATSKNKVEISRNQETLAQHVLCGIIIDSATGKGLSNVHVRAISQDRSNEEFEATTETDGTYSMMVGDGEYLIYLQRDGYIDEETDIEILQSAAEMTENFAMTEELGDDVIRIVLTWESTPRDLDSYLSGTDGDGNAIFTSFYHKKSENSKGVVAELDLDDRDGEGPETTTLYDMKGHYEFTVVDYFTTGTMAAMGAEVNVYKGSSLIESISISSDVENVWSVLEIDAGNVTVVNTASSKSTTPGSK